MALISRRSLLIGAVAAGALGGHSIGVEPGLLLKVTSYHLQLPGWPAGKGLKIAVIADLHACEPWMSFGYIRHIAEVANGLKPDVTVLLGDFNAGHDLVTRAVLPEQWAEALAVLNAPLGIHAVLGNHDWWHGALPKLRGDGGESVRRGLRQARFNVLENDALRLEKDGAAFWLLGLADQMAYNQPGQRGLHGADDLSGTLARVTDDAPAILLAHEPYVFTRVPERVALTLSGHTHGGQVNLPGLRNMRAFARGSTLAPNYGHVADGARQMIISAGLGSSIFPVRFMRPPEIVEIDVSGPAA